MYNDKKNKRGYEVKGLLKGSDIKAYALDLCSTKFDEWNISGGRNKTTRQVTLGVPMDERRKDEDDLADANPIPQLLGVNKIRENPEEECIVSLSEKACHREQ